LAKQIIEKCEKASEITGLPINKDYATVQYAYSHAYGSLKEPWKPEPAKPSTGWNNLEVW
jgi:hypothetical protein